MQESASTDVARPQGGPSSLLDRATLLSLYREQERRIYRLCLGYLKNAADAEDATQEAFVKAARHLDQLAGDPSAYLTVIARNVCCDELRRRGRLGEGIPESAPDGHHGSDAEAAAIARSTLHQAMTRLRRHEKEHLLYSFAGYSYDEMAQRTGLSVTAVASIISRARQRARQAAESVASVVGPVALAHRLGGRLARRVGTLPADTVASGLMGAQQAGVLVATIVAGLVGGAALGGGPATLSHPALAAADLQNDSNRDSNVGPSLSASAGTARAATSNTDMSNSSGQAAAGPGATAGAVVNAVLPPPQQQDVAFSDVQPSPHYAQDGTVFASGMRANGCTQAACPVLFRSTDRGHTWTALPALGFAGGQILLPPSYPVDPAIYAMGPSGLQRSTDGGADFTVVTPVTGPAAVAPDSAPGAVRILIGQTPLVEYRQGAQPELSAGPLLPAGMSSVDDVAFAGDASHVVVTGSAPDPSGRGLHDGLVVDCAPTCREILSTPTTSYFHLTISPTFAQDHTYFAGSPDALEVSRDGGASMAAATTTLPGVLSGLALDPGFAGDGRLELSGYRLGAGNVHQPFLAASSDGGRSFQALPATGLSTDYSVNSVAMLPGGGLIAALSGPTGDFVFGLRCSSDGGLTWRQSC